MDCLRLARQLQERARLWGYKGRLLVIPAVLAGLVPHAIAVTVYLIMADPTIWVDRIPWMGVILKGMLGVGAPLSLALVWKRSKPARRIVWVYDWLGGGLICISVVWMGNLTQDVLHPDRLGPMGRLLIPFSTAVWGGIGIGLMIAGTAYLSDELRTERQERQRLEALMEFTRRITSLDYQTTLNETVRHLQRLLQADACVLYLWDETESVLIPVADYHDHRMYTEDYIARMMSFKCPTGYGLTGWVMQSGEPTITGDVGADARSQAMPGYTMGHKSSLVAPMRVEGRSLGVVRLTRYGLDQFTQDDLDFVMSFAGQAALVLEHGRIVKELSDLSITDPLTGLFNARHFHQVLEVEVRRAQRYSQPLSLIMLDSDSLKKVNDLLGHQRGDDHLRSIGHALKASIRLTDYAFRYAGDEFLLMLPNTAPEEARVVAERVRKLSEVEEIGEGLHGTVSVGVATMPFHAQDGESLLAAADWAMYESKRAGKNRVSLAHPAWAEQRS